MFIYSLHELKEIKMYTNCNKKERWGTSHKIRVLPVARLKYHLISVGIIENQK